MASRERKEGIAQQIKCRHAKCYKSTVFGWSVIVGLAFSGRYRIAALPSGLPAEVSTVELERRESDPLPRRGEHVTTSRWGAIGRDETREGFEQQDFGAVFAGEPATIYVTEPLFCDFMGLLRGMSPCAP